VPARDGSLEALARSVRPAYIVRMPRGHITRLRGHARNFFEFIGRSDYLGEPPGPDSCDFVFGNPHDMPLPGIVEALQRHAVPQDARWFAYKTSEREATEPVARSLRELTGLPFEADDVLMTTGAFGALAVALHTLVEPGDEVLFFDPPWFFYEIMIAAAGGIPKSLRLAPPRFEPDPVALAEAIGERTRVVIFNHPHNPSGRVYGPETLATFAQVLSDASERLGRPVYALADESYRRILFDGREFHSLMARYPNALGIYTYGKTLLVPGQRVGYIALPPTMPEREELREELETMQFALGFAFPNALLQHALADLEAQCIDVSQLQRRRDVLVPALRDAGYEVIEPEGTFYVLVRSPDPEDEAFCTRLAAEGVHVMPGSVCSLPGWLRLSLTASDAMVEQALPTFAKLGPHAR
jgi:aspartate aminotransferase